MEDRSARCTTRAGGATWDDSSDETPVQPRSTPAGRQPRASVPQPADEGMKHPQPHQLQQHLGPQSPPPSADAPLPGATGKSSPTRTVERLAHQLSEQNLRLDGQSHGRPQPQLQPPWLSSPAGLPDAPELPSFRQWAGQEPGNHAQQLVAPPPLARRITPWLLSVPDVSPPTEVDEAHFDKLDEGRPEGRRLHRQSSAHLRGGHHNARPVHPRLEDMIANETQCTVRTDPSPVPTVPARPTPLPPPPSPSLSASTGITRLPYIEPDPDYAMPNCDPEPDDAGDELMPDILWGELALAEGSIPLRAALGPGGVRKKTVGGVSLRYRLSADAALRCANVVRSRPRMRKRPKTGQGSTTSSAATSVAPSPVISASVPSLPQPPPAPPP